ncbi:alpha/beta fold hydrolase [Baekduia sp. Peel2402]|uniref:alpha/beta fold hydrolase n=1 Tax=Baekduia sp. Peel2402 TaxID=3458296 RepID=UPI00403EC4AA
MSVDVFSEAYRGGNGEPLVLLHGFTDTWRTWELVLPSLERRFDVLAPTLAGHAGGPRITDAVTADTLPDAVERAIDEAGWETAHLVGNSLGGFVALQLAARGRARSVTALAPAGGWARGEDSYKDTLQHFITVRDGLRPAVANADAIMSTDRGRRNATTFTTVNYQHISPRLLAHQLRGVIACTALDDLVTFAAREGYTLDAGAIDCPVRIVWGTSDRLLPWPSAAARYRTDWLPHADWIVLDSIGHCPQLDDPTTTSALITDFIIT